MILVVKVAISKVSNMRLPNEDPDIETREISSLHGLIDLMKEFDEGLIIHNIDKKNGDSSYKVKDTEMTISIYDDWNE